MASDAAPIISLPQVSTLANGDFVVCVSNSASNGGNVALISISNLTQLLKNNGL